MCNKVLFPAPDSPTIASISPRFTSNDRFSKSTRSDSPDRNTFFKPSTRSKVSCSATRSLRCTLPPLRSILSQPQAPGGGNGRSGHLLTLTSHSTWHLCPIRPIWKFGRGGPARFSESRLSKLYSLSLNVLRPRRDLGHECNMPRTPARG